MEWLVCYDISDDRRRAQACRLLRQHSSGYQNSGFETVAGSVQQTEHFFTALQDIVRPEDYLMVVRHDANGPDWRLGKSETAKVEEWRVWT